jgi:hypothetical protein
MEIGNLYEIAALEPKAQVLFSQPKKPKETGFLERDFR